MRVELWIHYINRCICATDTNVKITHVQIHGSHNIYPQFGPRNLAHAHGQIAHGVAAIDSCVHAKVFGQTAKLYCVTHLTNRIRFLCFHTFMATCVEVLENEKSCKNTGHRVFSQMFQVLPNSHKCCDDFMETTVRTFSSFFYKMNTWEFFSASIELWYMAFDQSLHHSILFIL